ncbi:MAG: hypothetical protein FJ387_18755 [Verrucomicrobia bacterium]|nr:hypothetical protein [Verrucomicrobiota bacterium]
MKRRMGLVLVVALGALVVLIYYLDRRGGFLGGPIEVATCVPAPPAPADTGPIASLPDLAPNAVAFDLTYRPQTGGKDDIPYNAFWGFGYGDGKDSRFLQQVRQQTGQVYPVHHALLSGRDWSAVEHAGRKILAFYFDLDADGQLGEGEKLPPTTAPNDFSVDFITPDFRLAADTSEPNSGEEEGVLFRVLLRLSSYSRAEREPHFMWSPACLLEGTATLNGQTAQLVLFADGFGGRFDRFGSSHYALQLGDEVLSPGAYLPRETLSSLALADGRFYRVRFEGRKRTGHPARAVLTPDTSPTGRLALSLAGTNTVPCRVDWLTLKGADDQTVHFRVHDLEQRMPVARYTLDSGALFYGEESGMDWAVSFSGGPVAELKAEEPVEVALREPVMKVRVVPEKDRYNRSAQTSAVSSATFARGTRLYLEPQIVCRNQEVLTRFNRGRDRDNRGRDVAPSVRIASAEGRQLLAQTMEYG